jgi:hypothetical protein
LTAAAVVDVAPMPFDEVLEQAAAVNPAAQRSATHSSRRLTRRGPGIIPLIAIGSVYRGTATVSRTPRRDVRTRARTVPS